LQKASEWSCTRARSGPVGRPSIVIIDDKSLLHQYSLSCSVRRCAHAAAGLRIDQVAQLYRVCIMLRALSA
jgi:hypothetical protein